MLLISGLSVRLLVIYLTVLIIQFTDGGSVNDSRSNDNADGILLVLWSSSSLYNTSSIVSSAVDQARIDLPTTLHVEQKDTMCNENQAIAIVEDYLRNNSSEQLSAIVGCGCPSVTSAVIAYLASFHPVTNLTNNFPAVVSYDSFVLESHVDYEPYLFSTSPIFNGGIHIALADLMTYFKWKRVLFISEEISIHRKDFNEYLLQRGISLYHRSVTESENFLPTSNGIHILDTYGPNTRKILCQAYQEAIYYPGYAWLIVDNFLDNDWYMVADTSCTTDQIQRVLRYSIIIGTSPDNKRENIFAYSYNALTAVSIAAQNHYNDTIADALMKVPSMNDNISFIDANDTSILFTQLRNSHEKQFLTLTGNIIGTYSYSTRLVINQSSNSIWPDDVPKDLIPIIVIEKVQMWAFALTILLSIAGGVCIVICFLFTFLFRKSKLIKLTSPNLNYLLLLGAVSVFISIILYGLPSTDKRVFDVICPVQPFLGSIFGYDLCVTITTVKLWRLYYIFKGPKQTARIPKDWQLFIGISIILSIDCLFSIILIIIEVLWFPPVLIHENKPDSMDVVTGEVYTYYFWDCRHSTFIFTIVATVHNFIVHGIGIWFAFNLRKIEVTVLNEYKYNLGILFVSVAITVIAVILIYSVGADPTLYVIFYSLLITIGCIAFLCLTFVPKMIALKNDPNGDRLFPDNIGNNNIKAYENSSEKPPSSLTIKPNAPPNTEEP